VSEQPLMEQPKMFFFQVKTFATHRQLPLWLKSLSSFTRSWQYYRIQVLSSDCISPCSISLQYSTDDDPLTNGKSWRDPILLCKPPRPTRCEKIPPPCEKAVCPVQCSGGTYRLLYTERK